MTDEYRLLTNGEIIQTGDEYLAGDGSWIARDVTVGTYRRRQQLMAEQLKAWLDTQDITSDNIGRIRLQCFVPWASDWNALVRDETALREYTAMPTPDIRML